MPAIVLWAPWPDSLSGNAELYPPDAKLREAGDGLCGKWISIVGADGVGQPVLTEESFKNRDRSGLRSRRKAMASQEIARVRVSNGQGVAIDAVPGLELSLEVDPPDFVSPDISPALMIARGAVLRPSSIADPLLPHRFSHCVRAAPLPVTSHG